MRPPVRRGCNFIGGGAQSDLWCQIHADVLEPTDPPGRAPDPRQRPRRRAARRVSRSAGSTSTTLARRWRSRRRHEPDPRTAASYDDAYGAFRSIYTKNKGMYRRAEWAPPAEPAEESLTMADQMSETTRISDPTTSDGDRSTMRRRAMPHQTRPPSRSTLPRRSSLPRPVSTATTECRRRVATGPTPRRDAGDARADEESRWADGFASGSVYHGDPDHIVFLNEAYAINSPGQPPPRRPVAERREVRGRDRGHDRRHGRRWSGWGRDRVRLGLLGRHRLDPVGHEGLPGPWPAERHHPAQPGRRAPALTPPSRRPASTSPWSFARCRWPPTDEPMSRP